MFEDRNVEQVAVIFTFPSTHFAIKAERLAMAAGIRARLIPMPRQLSSLCGVVLEVAAADEEQTLRAFLPAVRLEQKLRVTKKLSLILEIQDVVVYEHGE